MVTKVTARMGLISALVALGCGVPTSVGAAPRVAQATSVGDHCLIGTWRAYPAEVPVEFHHQTVDLHYGGGDYLHLRHNGDQVDSFRHSRLYEGYPNGLPLKLHIRGTFIAHAKGLAGDSESNGHELKVLKLTGGHWTSDSYIKATYNGQKVKFQFTNFEAHFDAYTCSTHTLAYIDGTLTVHQTYFRRSFTP